MIGILPAAGQATRIHGLPKWALPIPDGYLLKWHIDGQKAAGCRLVTIGSRDTQSGDLLQSYAPNAGVYLAVRHDTMSATVMSAYDNLIDEIIKETDAYLFSMPDTYFDDADAFCKLTAALDDGADVAVGLFAAREGQRDGGMCAVSGNQVAEVIDKPASANYMHMYPYIWGALAWRPAFWELLDASEPHVGYALPRAIEAGLDVRAVVCEGGYWDCGTVSGYFALINHLTREAVTA